MSDTLQRILRIAMPITAGLVLNIGIMHLKRAMQNRRLKPKKEADNAQEGAGKKQPVAPPTKRYGEEAVRAPFDDPQGMGGGEG